MQAANRIVVNTVILYCKLIITIVVNLFATRLILGAMGVDDFGIVNLVSGIVAMLSFIQNSMTISTQRYLSVNMGIKDEKEQSVIFNTSVILHLILGCFIVLILELCAPFIFDSAIQIPADRIPASKILYQCTIISTFIVIIMVPYDATLNAHENMLVFSLASITESLIRLTGAILLLYYTHDKLIFYGILVICVRLVSFLFKSLYCRHTYPDSLVKPKICRYSLMKEMFFFAFWNFFGSFAVTARTQGIAIVLNIFHGVAINSAYGVATQVSGQLSSFTSTISKAMSPQIMQNKGAGHISSMVSLALKQSKFSFALLLIVAIPLFLEMPYILKVWLNDVPEFSVQFCRLILMVALIQQLSSGMQLAIQANGKISLYQITISIALLLNIPVAWILLKCVEVEPYMVLTSMLSIELLCLVVRSVFLIKLVSIKWTVLAKELFYPIIILLVISLSVAYAMSFLSICKPLIEFCIYLCMTVVTVAISLYITFSNQEKQFVKETMNRIIFKFIRK